MRWTRRASLAEIETKKELPGTGKFLNSALTAASRAVLNDARSREGT
jgi:hypothetical protein